MKKLLLLLCFFCIVAAKAQDDTPQIQQQNIPAETSPDQDVETEDILRDYVRLYYVVPDGIGHNVLSEANEGQGGVGLGVNIYHYKNFSAIVGVESANYKITDIAITVNGTRTFLRTLYAGVEYNLHMGKYFSLSPSACYSFGNMAQRNNEKLLGRYYGSGIRTTLTLDFAIIPNLKIFAGASLIHTWYNVDTEPQYKAFYREVSTLNLTAGIKIAI